MSNDRGCCTSPSCAAPTPMRGWARSICRGCGSDPAWSPPYIAEDAPVDIAVEYQPLPAVIDLERALAPDTVRVHDDVDGNVAARVHQRKGDSDAARQAAALLPHRRFRCDRGAPRRSRCVGWWPSLGDRNFPIAGTASDRFRGNSGRSAGAADRRRRANRGGQRAAQQQEIIALHLRRQSRTAPKMLDRRSAGWRHRSCTPALRICSSLWFDRAHFIQRTVSVLKCR